MIDPEGGDQGKSVSYSAPTNIPRGGPVASRNGVDPEGNTIGGVVTGIHVGQFSRIVLIYRALGS